MLTMDSPVFPFTFWIAFSVTIFGTALASQNVRPHSVKRIYVEPFVTQTGSQKFRDDVIAELRKLSSVSLAPDKSGADAIVWGRRRRLGKGILQSQPAVKQGASQRSAGIYRLPFRGIEG